MNGIFKNGRRGGGGGGSRAKPLNPIWNCIIEQILSSLCACRGVGVDEV